MEKLFRAYFAPLFVDEDTRLIAQDLIGSAQSIQYHITGLSLEDYYDNEMDLNTELFDSIVFNCTGCNWYCGADECNDVDGEWFCDDCAREIEGKE